jgi:hypothetical protein
MVHLNPFSFEIFEIILLQKNCKNYGKRMQNKEKGRKEKIV